MKLDPYTPFRVDGKAVIVTGASSGLGHRFAKVLTAAGADVVASGRRADRLAELVKGEDRLLAVPGDITAPGSAARLVDATIEAFGRIDAVVNCAGISRAVAAIDDGIDDFRDEVEINLIAPYELARTAARWMIDKDRPGSIVNIGSVLGELGGGRMKVPGYAASKGGIHNLTRELASQWARRNIRVNAIAPGWFETEMNSDMFGTDGGMSYIVDNTPMGRPGLEGELDGALLFLISDASTFVTGHVLFVDGGWSAI